MRPKTDYFELTWAECQEHAAVMDCDKSIVTAEDVLPGGGGLDDFRDFIWRRACTVDVKHWVDSGEWKAGSGLTAGTWSLRWREDQFSRSAFTFVQEAPRISVLGPVSRSKLLVMANTTGQRHALISC